MPRRQPKYWELNGGGYAPSQVKLPPIPGTIVAGKNSFYRGLDQWESSRGVAASGSNGGVRHLLNVNNTHGGLSGNGSLLRFLAAYVLAGSGTAFVGGSSIAAAGATLVIKPDSGTAKAVGVATPSAPVISDSGVAGLLDGTVSIALTGVSDLGEEGNRSAPSNVISLTLKKARFTTPALPSGASRFGPYVNRKGFGKEGPWFYHTRLGDILPGTYDIDWVDGELGHLAPLDHDPPPPCTFAGALNSMLLAIGAYDNMIAPSIPGEFGAFPPDWPVALPGTPTGVKASGIDDSLIIATASSLCGVRDSGASTVTPIAVWVIWPTTGFANSSNFCTYKDYIYGFTGQPVRSPFRTEDAPIDSSFAIPVEGEFARLGFTKDNAVVGHDPRGKNIVFIAGAWALPYSVVTGKWSTPQELPASIITAATVGGELLLGASGGQMYVLDSGSGSSWELIPYWQDVGDGEFLCTIIRVACSTNASINVDILTNLNEVTSRFNATLPANHSGWRPCNVQGAASVTLKLSGTGAGQTPRRPAMLTIPHHVTLATSGS